MGRNTNHDFSNPLVVVHYLDVLGASGGPDKTDPILAIDTDAVLALAILCERFQLILGGNPQILQNLGGIQLIQLPRGDTPQLLRQDLPGSFGMAPIKDVRGPGSTKGLDHGLHGITDTMLSQDPSHGGLTDQLPLATRAKTQLATAGDSKDSPNTMRVEARSGQVRSHLTRPTSVAIELCEQFLHRSSQDRQFGLKCVEGLTNIHSQVVVYKHIAKSGERPPLHLWVSLLESVGKALRGLCHDLQAAQYCVLGHSILQECLTIVADVLLHRLDALKHVTEKYLRLLHNGTASERTDSRSSE